MRQTSFLVLALYPRVNSRLLLVGLRDAARRMMRRRGTARVGSSTTLLRPTDMYPQRGMVRWHAAKHFHLHPNNNTSMSNIYRIYPTLWDGSSCGASASIYAADRAPGSGGFQTTCSTRPRADPASVWDSPTFQRLLPPPQSSGCWGPANAVTWATLPAWISWVQTLGYVLAEGSSLQKLKPYGELYIVGP